MGKDSVDRFWENAENIWGLKKTKVTELDPTAPPGKCVVPLRWAIISLDLKCAVVVGGQERQHVLIQNASDLRSTFKLNVV